MHSLLMILLGRGYGQMLCHIFLPIFSVATITIVQEHTHVIRALIDAELVVQSVQTANLVILAWVLFVCL